MSNTMNLILDKIGLKIQAIQDEEDKEFYDMICSQDNKPICKYEDLKVVIKELFPLIEKIDIIESGNDVKNINSKLKDLDKGNSAYMYLKACKGAYTKAEKMNELNQEKAVYQSIISDVSELSEKVAFDIITKEEAVVEYSKNHESCFIESFKDIMTCKLNAIEKKKHIISELKKQ